MPSYNWTCQRCNEMVLAQHEHCQLCGCPSRVSAASLERMKYVWDNHLSIRFNLGESSQSNDQFKSNPSNKSHFAAQLLLYDRILIPTRDFGIIPILTHWCGIDGLNNLIENNALLFIWEKHTISYGGNGFGLTRMAVDEPSSGWENWQQVALWADLELSVEAQVTNSIVTLPHKQKSRLVEQVINNSLRQMEPELQIIKEETAQDLSKNISLNRALHNYEGGKSNRVNIQRLSGIGDNQIRILSNNSINDGVSLFLNIAEFNKIILNSSSIRNCDLLMPNGTIDLFKSKLLRSLVRPNLINQFFSLLTQVELPDIRPAIENGEIQFSDIIKLRNRYRSRQFRKWIHGKKVVGASDLQQAYIRSLYSLNHQSLPKRVLRKFATMAASSINPLEYFGSNVVESYFVEKWLGGYNPSLFLDDVGALPIDNYRNIEE